MRIAINPPTHPVLVLTVRPPKLSGVSSDATPDRDATPEQFVSRAALLADLGRYDEAAAELGFAVALDPASTEALTLLARVHLAAGRPAEALAAADASLAAAAGAAGPGHADTPGTASGSAEPSGTAPGAASVPGPASTDTLAARAMALIDLRRFGEAADVAEWILDQRPDDAEALSTGAALLSESRNGQRALNAAWRAVELAPDRADTHLVLGLVAGRLGQFQLSEKAYRKALELDPDLIDVHVSIGVIQLEQRRYTDALASLAEAAAQQPAAGTPDAVSRVANPMAHGVWVLVRLGAGYAMLVPILVACAASGNPALGRLQSIAMGIIGIGMLAVMVTRLPGRPLAVLRSLMTTDRRLGTAIYSVAAGPPLVIAYALMGSPQPLVAAVILGFLALLLDLFPRRR